MTNWKKWIDYLLIGLLAMLLFLWIFDHQLEVPAYIQPLGRMHPLLLHLPIGLFISIGILLVFKKELSPESYDKLFDALAAINCLFAVLTAIFGLFLSMENGYNPDQIAYHKWSGILFVVLAYSLYFLRKKQENKMKFIYPSALFSMIVAGHLGGEITHGENYVFAPVMQTEVKEFDPSISVYESAIFPILEAKCLSCHNDKKTKGALNMSSLEKILKGGEDGPIWVPGNALNSHIIQMANLPLDDKKHMPPKGKPQLTADEIDLLTQWIRKGANTEILFTQLKPSDSLTAMIQKKYMSNSSVEKNYDFAFASESTIESVNTPFCTVVPLANGSPALKANFFVSARFDEKSLEGLKKVAEQLVELNLSKMPVKNEHLQTLTQFKNLEKLNLNFTNIDGENLDILKACKNLVSLSLSGSKISSKGLKALESLESLKDVYLWNTGLSVKEIEEFGKAHPAISLNKGYIPSAEDILKINSPNMVSKNGVLKKGEKAQLKHSLPNVTIRYTTNGESPDTLKGSVYENEIPLDGFARVKAIATKDGWYASDEKVFTFFKSNFAAESAWLLSPPDKQYPGVGPSTVIDQKQGDKNNFKDFAWLGYKQNNAEILVKTKAADTVSGITVSYLNASNSYIMPPSEIQVWAGNDKNNLELVSRKSPTPLTKNTGVTYDALNFSLSKKYDFIKVIAVPLAKLPKWHEGAGQRGWVFIDEIYLY